AGGCSPGADADAAAETILVARAGRSSRDTASAAPDSAQRTGQIEILRETFVYQGGPRDPFNSLIAGAATGPELADLLLVGVYENVESPSKSVVVLREKVGEKRHKMRVGDRIGRIRLAQIRPREAVFMIQDLGFERQETLSLRKQEDVTP